MEGGISARLEGIGARAIHCPSRLDCRFSFSGAIQPAIDVKNWLRFVTQVDTRAQYYGRFAQANGAFSPADQMAAADYVRAHTTATDRIAVFGYDAPVVYLSHRANATRFSYALPLVGPRSSRAVRERYRREFLDALADPPAYLVVGLLFAGKERALADWPEFREFLAKGYLLERSFGTVDLYRRVSR